MYLAGWFLVKQKIKNKQKYQTFKMVTMTTIFVKNFLKTASD